MSRTKMHELMAATLDTVIGEIQRIKADARQNGFTGAPALADDRAAHAQGLDLPEGDRRQAHRGLLARASGADGRDAREPGPCAHPRRVDEELPPAELFDEQRPAPARTGRARPARHPPHERQSAHQWRLAAARPAAAGFPRLRRRGADTRRRHGRIHPGHGQVPARCHEAEHGGAELPAVQPGREQLQPLAGRARGHQPRLGRGDRAMGRPPRARRAGDGDAERAPVPGLARRLSADRPARLLLLLRGLHPHHRSRCSTSTPSG